MSPEAVRAGCDRAGWRDAGLVGSPSTVGVRFAPGGYQTYATKAPEAAELDHPDRGRSDDDPHRCPGADRPPCCPRLWSAHRSRDVAEMGVDRHGVPSARAAAPGCRLAPPADQ